MKKIKLFLAMIVAVATFGGIGVVNAVNGAVTSSTTNHRIVLSRSVTGVTNPVTNTFTYTVSADSNNPSGATGIPTTGTVEFDGATPSSGTVTRTGVIDFAGASFTANGDYLYTITETGSTDNITYPKDTTSSYAVKIAVRNASASDFSSKTVTIYFYSSTSTQDSTTKLNNEIMRFTSEAVFRTITISHTVSGTMADADLYFPIDVNVSGVGTYSVTGQTYDGAVNFITAGSAGTLYLKHGESLTITGIPNGQTYSIEESNSSPYSNYTTTIDGTSGKSKSNMTVGATNNNAIVNTYSGTTITGIFTKFTPYIILISVAIIGIILFIVTYTKNRKRKALEDIK